MHDQLQGHRAGSKHQREYLFVASGRYLSTLLLHMENLSATLMKLSRTCFIKRFFFCTSFRNIKHCIDNLRLGRLCHSAGSDKRRN